MPENKFSEFSFGFAFTQEVTSLFWDALPGAPEMPSLYDEGAGKGFDVSLGLYGWTLFAQFKRGTFLTRSTAREWDSYHASYFRFDVYPPSKSSQHQDLLQLQAASAFNWVVYVAPAFHEIHDLNQRFLTRAVLDGVQMIPPSEIGPPDGDEHHITFQGALDIPLVHSEPRPIESRLRKVDLERLLEETSQDQRDQEIEESVDALPDTGIPSADRLDEEFFDSLYESLQSISADRLPQTAVENLRDMTAFGRARTAGRLLFDAELIALPVPGQTIEAS